ncbi:thiamine ABC transporter substrate-binding protein [Brucepastera parasyntrophica]|uniref:thiamine ABC transporter substrate-binding protein n=1 Tax=Brucepastera parasyntrophica TaxID=2880008 RepID=UPI00210C1ED4|nr:thiamine ABC transporter substrate-binding protein [Brucepastera parasyntrophica]
MIYDTASGITKPESLEDLLNPAYAKKIILMDPRTSTPGAGFLAWTIAVYGDAYPEYWSALKPNILTLAPGWDTGYGLFTAGEAPLVISYTTSPPYHVEYDNTSRFQALIFEEGHVMQIEGMGITANARHPEAAEAFIEFMLTDEAQSVIPQTQWMYPVSETVTLPASFDAAPAARTILSVPAGEVQSAVDRVISILAER